jgi:predicted nucleic acid-binding protein
MSMASLQGGVFVMKRLFTTLALSLCISCLAPSYGLAQNIVKAHRSQFTELRGQVKTILEEVEQKSKTGLSEKGKLDKQQEILAFTKLIHKLSEEALSSNLDILKGGQNSNKTLLRISMECSALTVVLEALGNFLETGDRDFLSFAKEQDQLVK